MADLRGFTEKPRSQLTSGEDERAAGRRGARVGGRYDKEIRQIITHLEAAIPFATEPMANALRALVQWYRTGRQPTG